MEYFPLDANKTRSRIVNFFVEPMSVDRSVNCSGIDLDYLYPYEQQKLIETDHKQRQKIAFTYDVLFRVWYLKKMKINLLEFIKIISI